MHQSRVKITFLSLFFGLNGLISYGQGIVQRQVPEKFSPKHPRHQAGAVRVTPSDTDYGSLAPPDKTLWFTYPAEEWNSQSLHIGNGYMGASFYGGVAQEQLDIAEKTFYAGGPNVMTNYNYGIVEGGKEKLPLIRQLILAGEYAKADSLCAIYMKGTFDNFGAFSMVGQLLLNFENHEGEATEYVRALDLANSLATVSYQLNGTHYSREYFCSYPDKVMVCRFSSDKKDKISFDVNHQLAHEFEDLKYNAHDNIHEIVFRGKLKNNGLDFCIRIVLVPEGGTVAFKDKILSVDNADKVTLIYSVDTEYKANGRNYKGIDPIAETQKNISNALAKGYQALKDTHIKDYKNLFDRVKFTMVGNPDIAKMPTNERVNLLKKGTTDDSALKVLYFNLGRYLIISASRPGTLPSTLQGVWNENISSPWWGNYQSNINLQEMYWACGPTNLPECQEAYIEWIEALVPSGRKVAASYYGTKGWVSHTQGNIWGYAAPGINLKWGLYPVGAAWHCRHLWSQYEYTRNVEYLKNRAYPIMKEAAVFWLENLVEKDGYLISIPSVSAEHPILMKDGKVAKYTDTDGEPGVLKTHIFTVPCFQDIEMVYDLFSNVIKASEALNIDMEFRQKVFEAWNKLYPLKIGKYGQLQEWLEDYDNARDHHRHIAHLYAVYPGEMISVNKTPELAEAAKVSLNMREEGFITPIWPWSGGNWSMAWRIACWTRLHDGERAIKIFNLMTKETGFENLMNSQPYNGEWYRMQVDASMATPGVFAEMLLQSENDNLYLLPALPTEWPEGEIAGLCAKGGYIVNMSWEYGQLKKAEIFLPKGATLPVIFAKGKLLQQTDKRLIIHNFYRCEI